jgi:hypothetical protein
MRPHVRVPGDDSQRRVCASGDGDRRMGSLHGLGAAERAGQLVLAAVEVEGLRLGPESADDGAGLIQAVDRWREVVEGQTLGRVLAPGFAGSGTRSHLDAELEPSG